MMSEGNNSQVMNGRNESILLKLHGLYNSLRPAEKKIADYVIANPQEIMNTTITDLAERSNVSEATVIRFCRHLGLSGFQNLKIVFAQELVTPLKTIHEAIEDDDDPMSITRKVYHSDMQAIEDSLMVIDEKELIRAIDALESAQKIVFIGVGGSGIVALDAEHKFQKTGKVVVAYPDVFMQTMAATLSSENDVIVGISHTGSTKSVVDALKLAQNSGATTICITQSTRSPITKVADIKLFVVSKESNYRDEGNGARIAQLALIDSLYVNLAKRDAKRNFEIITKARLAIASQRY